MRDPVPRSLWIQPTSMRSPSTTPPWEVEYPVPAGVSRTSESLNWYFPLPPFTAPSVLVGALRVLRFFVAICPPSHDPRITTRESCSLQIVNDLPVPRLHVDHVLVLARPPVGVNP